MDLEIIERIEECQNAEEVYFVPRFAVPPDGAYTIEHLAMMDCPFICHDGEGYLVRPYPGYTDWREHNVLAILTDTGYGDKGDGGYLLWE